MDPEDVISRVNYRYPICPYCDAIDPTIDVRPNSEKTIYCNNCNMPYQLWARVECTTFGDFREYKKRVN